MKLFYKILFIFLGKRIIFSSSSQPWPNNHHFNAYQYIHIRACFFTWGKARGVPDDINKTYDILKDTFLKTFLLSLCRQMDLEYEM